MSVFIVAEAGINHLGDRAKMLALCDAAKEAGADAVKFQAYEAEALGRRRGITDHPTATLLMRAQLYDADLDAIAAHCKSIGIKWFASVFDPSQVERVLSRGACALKIGHAEADYMELRRACLGRSVPTYMSNPHTQRNTIAVHCVAKYPAKPETDPPFAMLTEDDRGFSSHYADWRIPAASALFRVGYIEAHLKLSDSDPEAAWSLSVYDFGKMVKQIREYEGWL